MAGTGTRILRGCAIAFAAAVGLCVVVLVVVYNIMTDDPSNIRGPGHVYAYDANDSTTDLVIHYELACNEAFLSAKVVGEDDTTVTVEVWIDHIIIEGQGEDPPTHWCYFDEDDDLYAYETVTLHLREPLGDRTVIAFGEKIPSFLDPCENPPHAVTVVEFAPSGLTTERFGPSLMSEYRDDNPGAELTVIPLEFTDPSSWSVVEPSSACPDRPSFAVVNQDQLAEAMGDPSSFVDLAGLGAGWDESQVVSSVLSDWESETPGIYGLTATSGGLGLCYRVDLFEAAGLPSDYRDVATTLGDTWEGLASLGAQYRDATGKALLDDASSLFPLVLRQGQGLSPFVGEDGQVDISETWAAFASTLAVVDAGVSAGVERGSAEWDAALVDGTFAAMPCSLPMLDHVYEVSEGSTARWAVTDIAGGGGSLDDVTYILPSHDFFDEEVMEAYGAMSWLLRPEQLARVALETGSLPLDGDLLESLEVRSQRHPLTGGQAVGAVFASSVLESITSPTLITLGVDVVAAIEGVLDAVEDGGLASADAWARAQVAAESAAR